MRSGREAIVDEVKGAAEGSGRGAPGDTVEEEEVEEMETLWGERG